MKRIYKYMAVAALVCSTALSSCDDDFARPPIVAPESPLAGMENTTIAQFKEMYWQDANNYAASIGKTAEGEDIIIKARVISSDLSSCLYQYLYVQDETGAMTIAARQVSSSTKLATQYGYGQEIYINATSLYAGRYAGLFQIGNSTDGSSTTFLDNSVLLEHVSPNGLGQPEKIDVWTVTIPELQAALGNTADLKKYQAHAVRFENVHFTQPGQAFVPVSGTDSSVGFADADGNSLIIRMNRYCTFGNTNVPAGTGNISGELGYFNGVWQVVINSIDDLEGFDFENGGNTPDEPEEPGTPEGEGTAESPYNAAKALEVAKALAADATTESEVYVKGTVSTIQELSTQFGNATYTLSDEGSSATFDIYRSYYLNGDKFTSEDQLKAGDVVVVCGKLTNYKGNTPQMAQGGKIISINGETGGDSPDTPTEGTPEGDGTEANPFNSLKAYQTTTALAADATTETEYYVKGIVSSITELSTSFGNATYSITSEGTTQAFDIFRGYYLNGDRFTAEDQLKVGDEVVVCGKLVNYKGNTPQMAQGSKIVSINNQTGGGDTPDTPTPEGEGTADNPFSSLTAYQTTAALAADATTETEYYVKGIVSSITELSTSFGNATYSITSEGTTQAFVIFRGYYLNGDKFTSEDQLKVGDEVVVCGKLVNYKGNTPEMAQGNRIVSINRSNNS